MTPMPSSGSSEATALEHNLPLCTANVRHYRQIPSLAIIDFPVLS
jgi:predicted nucleic acid-binding protein